MSGLKFKILLVAVLFVLLSITQVFATPATPIGNTMQASWRVTDFISMNFQAFAIDVALRPNSYVHYPQLDMILGAIDELLIEAKKNGANASYVVVTKDGTRHSFIIPILVAERIAAIFPNIGNEDKIKILKSVRTKFPELSNREMDEVVIEDIHRYQNPQVLSEYLEWLKVRRSAYETGCMNQKFFDSYLAGQIVKYLDNPDCVGILRTYINSTIDPRGTDKVAQGWLLALRVPSGVGRSTVLESGMAEQIADLTLPNAREMHERVASLREIKVINHEIRSRELDKRIIETSIEKLQRLRTERGNLDPNAIEGINRILAKLEVAKIRLGSTLHTLKVQEAKMAKK